VINENQELYSHLKYLVEGDDDTFFRPDQVLRWLAAVESSGVSETYPLVANAEISSRTAKEDPRRVDNGGIWHIDSKSFVRLSACIKCNTVIDCHEIHSNGWYQPLMLNKRALEVSTIALLPPYGLSLSV